MLHIASPGYRACLASDQLPLRVAFDGAPA